MSQLAWSAAIGVCARRHVNVCTVSGLMLHQCIMCSVTAALLYVNNSPCFAAFVRTDVKRCAVDEGQATSRAASLAGDFSAKARVKCSAAPVHA
jgi:hypothetical protein